MNIQKLAISTVAGTVLILLLDMVWYTMIMKDSMDMPAARLNEAGEPAPHMMWMIISYVVFAFAFSGIYTAWAHGSDSASKINAGLNFGIWSGVLIGLGLNLMWFSLTTFMTLSQTLTDSGYTIVKLVLLGIVVAYTTGIPGDGARGKDSGSGERGKDSGSGERGKATGSGE